MDYKDVKSRLAVIAAMDEFVAVGQSEFLQKYGFKAARQYMVPYKNHEIDTKPLLAAAHGIMFPDRGPLKNEFYGGKNAAGRFLVRLGFEVTGLEPKKSDWSLGEVELVLDGYLRLLKKQGEGKSFVKTSEIRLIADILEHRNENSVARKFGNISSILQRLDQPWIKGITPQHNSQLLLEAVIYDRLIGGKLANPSPKSLKETLEAAEKGVQVDPPKGKGFPKTERTFEGRKSDHDKRDQQNRTLGRLGEKWAVEYLRQAHCASGQNKVVWSSEEIGDGLGYDIEVCFDNGANTVYEIKTTSGGIKNPFFISQNEIDASKKHGKNYILMRIFEFPQNPKFYLLKGDLNKICMLDPTVFRALPS